jgi:mono/diheme cytochrome c family protein
MKTVASRRFLCMAGALAAAGTLAACSKPEVSPVSRGEYLVTMGGCDDCHTPKVFGPNGPDLDKARRLSGHPAGEKLPELPVSIIGPEQWGAVTNNHLTAWFGPWGVSFAANLTADASGLGGWTEDNFIQAMRTGKHAGSGRPILPPMPWMNFARMTDDDLRAVFAYLKSLPPVSNAVPAPIPPGAAPAAK